MTLSFEVEVTSDDLEAGVRGSCTLCPVALAVKRALLSNVDALDIRVGFRKVFVDMRDGHRYVGSLPDAAHNLILKFDRTRAGQPIKFNLDLRRSDVFVSREDPVHAVAMASGRYEPPQPHEPSGGRLKIGYYMMQVPKSESEA